MREVIKTILLSVLILITISSSVSCVDSNATTETETDFMIKEINKCKLTGLNYSVEIIRHENGSVISNIPTVICK